MITSVFNKIQTLFNNAIKGSSSSKRALDDSDDDDDQLFLDGPPLKRNRLGVSNFGINSSDKVYNIQSRISRSMSNFKDGKYLGTSAKIPTPRLSLYQNRRSGLTTSTPSNNDDYLSPTYSSFKFRPMVTSTSSKDDAIEDGITKKLKSSRLKQLTGSSTSKPSFTKVIKSTTRNLRGPFSAFKLSCTPRESFRLDDKERYRQLLRQYTTQEINSSRPISKRLAILGRPEFLDISDDTKNISNGAITKSRLDPASSSRYRLQFEKSEALPVAPLALPSLRKAIGYSSSKKVTKSVPVIDLELESSRTTRSTNGTKQDDDDDDILITKEIIPEKPKKSNSLEKHLRNSPFYGDRLLGDMSQFYRDKVKKLDSDSRDFSEVRKKREQARHEQFEKDFLNKVSKRISQLDITFPEEVVEVPEEEELPELTRDMEMVIERAFRGGRPDQVLADKFSIQITRRDIHTLAGLNWLNDEVINFYMNMLVERGQAKDFPSVYAFTTFFYSKLAKMGYGSVRRWTKKVDIFSYDLLLIPVHLGMHWCLAVIDIKNKMINYYDSMHGDNRKCLSDLSNYLVSEQEDKKKFTCKVSEFCQQLVKDIPQQMNGSDCGMFSCKFAEYLSRRADISFTQEHMPYFRRRMVYEIVTQKLL